MTADLDPRDLAEVRRRVVDPVVASLLRADEVDDVVLEIETQRLPGSDGAAELYDHLRDDLTESRFGWGQLRDGDYGVPGPPPPACGKAVPGVRGCAH